jgi:DNA-binding winged helix-turn-helix (wHTH) protein/tetratricopeptide (TPR) repeat protein
MGAQGSCIYEFGRFRLDPADRVLLREGQLLALTPKGFDLLLVLVRNAGRVVLKDQLMREVWPDTFVEENNLTVNISVLRKVLEEGSSGQSYIQTLPRRGYRFVASVRHSGESLPGTQRWSGEAETDSDILVGREPELRKLETSLTKAVQGSGRMIFITGEPGIGKTALSNAFLRLVSSRYPAAKFSQGRCQEQYGAGEPYLPVLESLSALLSGSHRDFVADVLRSYAPTWCLQFPSVFASDETRERLYRETVGATKERMLREMVDALGALASAAPLVLHFEDLHWADPSSTDLLRRLCHDMGNRRLLVTGTFRPEDVERGNRAFKNFLLEAQTHNQCEEMALGLLSREALRSYLNTRFANRFDAGFPDLIHRKTEGQPLFATSLVQFLVERGDIAKDEPASFQRGEDSNRIGECWILTRPLSELDLVVPANVRKMLQRKIEVLEVEDRRALEYASIQGEEFTSALLARLLGTDDMALEERLDHLDKVHRLIQTIGEEELPDETFTTRYRFTHVLYQNALYHDVVKKRRTVLHREAGDLMIRLYRDQAARLATQLAIHFERGRDFERAVEFLIQAGHNAMQIHANEKALEHYSRALEFIARLAPEKQASALCAIYQKRGAAYLATAQFDDAIQDFTNLLHQARAMDDRARQHSALNALAEVYFYAHRLDELDKCAGQALRIAEDLRDERLRVETIAFIAMRQDIVGELVEAKRGLDEVIRVARTLDYKRALLDGLAWRGQLYFFQSEYERAREVLVEALDLASDLRHGLLLLQTQFFLGLSLGNMGRISEALDVLRQATEMARRNGEQYWQAKIPNCIAWIYRELENFDQALKYDLEGLQVARARNVREAETNSLINLGFDRTQAADPEKALSSFGKAEAILEGDAWSRWRFKLRLVAGLATHHLSQWELHKAESYAQLLLKCATHYEARKYIAVAHKLLAEAAIARDDLVEANAHLNTALDLLAAYPVPVVEWRIYSLLGRLRLQLGDRLVGEGYERACRIVQSIAGNVEDEKLRASFLGSPAVQELFRRAGSCEPR